MVSVLLDLVALLLLLLLQQQSSSPLLSSLQGCLRTWHSVCGALSSANRVLMCE